MDEVTAGLLAGLPLALVFIVYMALRGQAFIDLVRGEDGLGSMSDQAAAYTITGAMVLVAFGLGAVAGLIYRWLASPALFLALAVGEAAVVSSVALMTRTALMSDKIALNFAAAAILGTLVPFFAA